ncbi:MAG: hypothetical protein V1767_02210 [Chloroflexota bacterium]
MTRGKKKLLSVMLGLQRRKYPIRRDEFGRSQRQQAFDLFGAKYRPAQIHRDKMVSLPLKTLFRYFQDWKKRGLPYVMQRKLFRENPEVSRKFIETLASHFEVSPEEIVLRMEKPWGILQLAKGELPEMKMERARSEKERRLEAALMLVYLAGKFRNSPEQVNQLAKDIVMLRNNDRLVIEKKEGKVIVRKEKIDGKPT